LYAGRVSHRRTTPKPYQFSYGVYYCEFDLDEIQEVARRIHVLAYNRFSVMSFYDSDHAPSGRTVRAEVRDHLTARGIELDGARVSLLTNTRILGYVFNPVSFYFVRSRDGVLQHVMAEVHNTHGEQHTYDLARLPGEEGVYCSRAEKEFYVSPFIDMEARYEFRALEDADGRLHIRIDEFQGASKFFRAQLDLDPRPLTNGNIALMLARYPLITLKTISLIHWHGLKLWLGGVRYRPNPGRQ
jgi:hypothetical protein